MGLDIPGLAQCGVAVVRPRGVLNEATIGRLSLALRHVFAADPRLVIIDAGGLQGWNHAGQRRLAEIAAYLTTRGGQMVLSAAGAHLRRTEPDLAALKVFADVPAILAVDAVTSATRRPPRMRRRRPLVFRRAELVHHSQYTMASQMGQVAAARAWASTVLDSWEFAGQADQVMAGLSELAANAVTYGFAETVEVTVRLWRKADDTRWLTVAVHDGNPAPPVLRTPRPMMEGEQRGWGLLIMIAHANAHGWHPDAGTPGKTVWFAHRVPAHRPESHHHRAPPNYS